MICQCPAHACIPLPGPHCDRRCCGYRTSSRPVTGLTNNDFVVLEDKKPQTIAFFEPHTASAAAVPAESLLPMPPGVFTNYPIEQPCDAINVLLLDALNTPIRDRCICISR